ncbi:MAG: bifunctional phosphoribosylaminoimidazolecarboxamide formyltransferase/IMP cyclohydrolase [Candidatus Omnitrophota bacterium]
MLRIRRVLISVWDKKGIGEFAKKLFDQKVEIVSTGKTAALLRKSGITVQEVSSLTSYPEILSGRLKTLHPKVFGGILANKRHPLHMEEIKTLNIAPFDMVVANLYPFPEKVKDNLGWDEMIEYIDIGGPAMLRAAGKNFKNVACVSSPSQYKLIVEELTRNKGFLSLDTLRKLAQEVFYLTKEYDNSIYNYFKGKQISTWNLELTGKLRYGENPHQKGSLHGKINVPRLKFNQLQGQELSFNNLLDLDTALLCVKEFGDPASVIVKHASICGVGVDKSLAASYKKAYLTDTVSSFGGIISLNRKVDRETASKIIDSEYKECVVAPSYSKEALRIFSSKKNLRVISADTDKAIFNSLNVRSTVFGFLIQDSDILTTDKSKLKVVTKRKPTQREIKDLILAWKVVKHVKSNAIVVAKNLCVLGIGTGQPSRVGALKIALEKSIKGTRGAVLASDGFFPKKDSITLAHRKGVKAIIQPGGSIKDPEIIKQCDDWGIAMLFTGIRHFRH